MNVLSSVVLGVDLGRTVTYKNPGQLPAVFPDCLATLHRLTHACKEVHIISRVNSAQMMKAAQWMHEYGFFNLTNILIRNMHFCEERRDKGIIAARLGVTHMIDDRPEVMASMPIGVIKMLFQPRAEDMKLFPNQGEVFNSWLDIRRFFFRSYECQTL